GVAFFLKEKKVLFTRWPLQIEIYQDPCCFSFLTEKWSQLLRESASSTICSTWQWQSIWWNQFGHGKELLVLAFYHGEKLIGLVPLFIQEVDGIKKMEFLGDASICDHMDVIAARGFEEEVYAATIDFLNKSQKEWEIVDFNGLPDTSCTYRAFPFLAEASGYLVTLKVEDTSPFIQLPSSWEEYLGSLSQKNRHELRRKMNKAEREGAITLYEVADPSSLDEAMEIFFRLHKKSNHMKSLFMINPMESFFQAVARAFLKEGWLRLFFLRFNSEPIAALYCFDYKNGMYVYNSGYDPQYAHISPGIVLFAHCVRTSIEEGKEVFSFLRGNETYKYRFGAEDSMIYRLIIENVRKSRNGNG
ncbi:MAG: GNAT family N-acetyltransferase, partial [Thermodesulfobacteriota bacterium]|nr:GNAT family N-acetyltransferase [Thermodesulfobacteriota bacterium]